MKLLLLEKYETALLLGQNNMQEYFTRSHCHQGEGFAYCCSFGSTQHNGSSDCIDRFKKEHNIVYRTLEGERRSIDLVTVDIWKNDQMLEETEDCMTSVR